jgi:hypothetical protein
MSSVPRWADVFFARDPAPARELVPRPWCHQARAVGVNPDAARAQRLRDAIGYRRLARAFDSCRA